MTTARPVLIIVDDDPLITDTLHFVLGKSFDVFVAASRSQAQSVLRQLSEPPSLALVDLGLPPSPQKPDEGFQLISELLAHSPTMKILVLSGQNEAFNVKHALTLGAVDFIPKPCDVERLQTILLNALQLQHAEQIEGALTSETSLPGLLGESAPIQTLRTQISQFADAPFPVLIEGESGSGKELVATSLHRLSKRANAPYLSINCAAISPLLAESILFGHGKGAFTGAANTQTGYFEDAGDGTLFLDEIGELPLELQAKLLRVLENGEYQRVGETQSRQSRARIVAATNRDLRTEVRNGKFRIDLYHRLSVFALRVPPLRDLENDRLLLLEHFSQFYARETGQALFTLDEQARQLWMDYHFPGNVRELRNIIIRLLANYAGETVTQSRLSSELDLIGQIKVKEIMLNDGDAITLHAYQHLRSEANINVDAVLKRWENAYVNAALKITHGNLSQAAKLLGINRTTLYSRIQTQEEYKE